MKSRWPVGLFCLGLLFFFQAGAAVELFLSRSRAEFERDKPRADDYRAMAAFPNRMASYIAEQDTGQLVISVTGSLFGCLGCWMFVLYMKTRRLERRLAELERDKTAAQADSGQSRS